MQTHHEAESLDMNSTKHFTFYTVFLQLFCNMVLEWGRGRASWLVNETKQWENLRCLSSVMLASLVIC